MPDLDLWRSKKDPPRDKRDGPQKKHNQLLQAGEPSIDLFAGLIFGVAVALLKTTLQLVALAVDRGEIIVSEFAPLFLHLAFYLFPISFNSVPVHGVDHLGSTLAHGPRSVDLPVSGPTNGGG